MWWYVKLFKVGLQDNTIFDRDLSTIVRLVKFLIIALASATLAVIIVRRVERVCNTPNSCPRKLSFKCIFAGTEKFYASVRKTFTVAIHFVYSVI